MRRGKFILGIGLCAYALPLWAEDGVLYEYDDEPLEEIVTQAGHPSKKAVAVDSVGPDGTYHKVVEDSISVSAVEAPSVDTVGVSQSKVLGADIWQGMDMAAVQAGLKNVPLDTSSTVARGLIENILLAPSQPPKGANSGVWLQSRLQRLLNMESYEALEKLLHAIPQPSRDESWHKFMLSSLIHRHAGEPVCAHVESAATKFPNNFWREKQLFCLGYRKEYEKAASLVEIMREQGHATPAWLQQAILSSAGEQKATLKPEQIKSLTAVDIALMGMADQQVTEAMLPAAVKDYPLMLATHPSLETSTRIRFAEEAVRRGLLPGTELTKMIEALDTQEASAATPIPPAIKDALEYRALQKEYAAKENITGLAAIFARYRAEGRSLLASRLYAAEMLNLSRAVYRKAQVGDFAYAAFAVLFANREFEEALLWLDTAVSAVPASPVGNAGAAYWRIATALSNSDVKKRDSSLTSAMGQVKSEQVTPQNAPTWRRLRAMLEGLEITIPESLLVLMPPLEAEAASKDVTALREAVSTGRKGEALLTLSRLISHPTRMTDAQMKVALEALRALDLSAEAYDLVHEALAAELLSAK